MRAEKWYGQRWTNPKRDLTDGNANLFLDDEDSRRGRGEDKLEGNSPLGHIAYRLNQMVNMVGEHVSTEDIEYVVKGISQHEKTAITEYALYTDYSTTPGRYIILIEPEVDMGKGEMKHLNDVADELFKKGNRSYKKYREQNTLGSPSIVYIDPGAFQLYKELQIASGISANQVKPVRLIDNKNKEQFFFGVFASTFNKFHNYIINTFFIYNNFIFNCES